MASNLSLNLTDSDVFYVDQSSNDQSIPRPNTPIVLNSTDISGDDTRKMISISSIASPEPQIVTIDDDSNEPTMPYGFGRLLPIIPPSLNDLNLPPNLFYHPGNDGSRKQHWGDQWWQLYPTITWPVRTLPNIDAPNERERLQQLGDVLHDD